ncbi:MAG: NUDIX hydrolase [Magnetococcales bacterium]|nr:NUDIX hydrolase [Magnetococcales bacterium]
MGEVPEHFFRQSAVIPLQRRKGKLRILLITTRGGGRWIVPKGVVQPGLSPERSAAKEALEEAGILGEVDPHPIGAYSYEKWGGTCTVTVFLMMVKEELPRWEEQFRYRKWFRRRQAMALLKEPELRKMVRGLKKKVIGRED